MVSNAFSESVKYIERVLLHYQTSELERTLGIIKAGPVWWGPDSMNPRVFSTVGN